MNTDWAETQAYGVTQRSTEFVEEQLKKVGSIVQIKCLLAGNTHLEFGKEQWVAFVDEHDDRIVVSGFSWGYLGEGSHGLFMMAQKLGFDLDMELIAHYPQDEYWTIYRERLQLTEDIASYIVSLQSVCDMEVGLTDEDYKLRDQLEIEFPSLKWERERSEFNSWLWGTRTEVEPDVVEARYLLGGHIPFDEVYHTDNPDAEESTYKLYREHTEVAGRIFQEIKKAADSRLIAQDKAGEIDLKKEWKSQQVKKNSLVEEEDDMPDILSYESTGIPRPY